MPLKNSTIYGYYKGVLPENILIRSVITSKTKKTKNNIRAISIDINSTPENPKNPATTASTKNSIIQYNIRSLFFIRFWLIQLHCHAS